LIAFLIPPIYAVCPANLILLGLIPLFYYLVKKCTSYEAPPELYCILKRS
jgi:hypothetical protein